MTPSFNGTLINSRTDWRSSFQPGPVQGSRYEQVPGIARYVAFRGPAMPQRVIFTGYLEGEGVSISNAYSDLLNQFETINDLAESDLPVSVSWHSETWSSCTILPARTLQAQPEACESSTPGNSKFRQMVAIEVRRLSK